MSYLKNVNTIVFPLCDALMKIYFYEKEEKADIYIEQNGGRFFIGSETRKVLAKYMKKTKEKIGMMFHGDIEELGCNNRIGLFGFSDTNTIIFLKYQPELEIVVFRDEERAYSITEDNLKEWCETIDNYCV